MGWQKSFGQILRGSLLHADMLMYNCLGSAFHLPITKLFFPEGILRNHVIPVFLKLVDRNHDSAPADKVSRSMVIQSVWTSVIHVGFKTKYTSAKINVLSIARRYGAITRCQSLCGNFDPMLQSALDRSSGTQVTSTRSARPDAQATCVMRFMSMDDTMGVTHVVVTTMMIAIIMTIAIEDAMDMTNVEAATIVIVVDVA